MLQRVVRLLGAVVSPIVVVAAREQSLPPLPDAVVITRDEREAKGPLEGIRAGLSALPESIDAAYITSCDVPLLVPAFVERMIDLMGDHDIAVMEIDGFPHPLSAIYRRDLLPQVESLLATDRLRPYSSSTPCERAAWKPEEMTWSIRTQDAAKPQHPEDYRAALADARPLQRFLRARRRWYSVTRASSGSR